MSHGKNKRDASLAAVVLAAGGGERFGTPKQYALLAGERLIDRAVRFARRFTDVVVVVLPGGHAWEGPAVHAAVAGGSSRTESLRNGMKVLPNGAELVLVHDVVRPLATAGIVPKLLEAIDAGADAAVPVWPLPDTLKELHEDGRLTHVGREGLVVAQSPIAFRTLTLSRMFDELPEIPIEETVGIERIGGRVAGVPGDPWSHHVVEPRDLALMERLLDLVDPGEETNPSD